jgi:predicted MFS family arabinose efflux permease
MIAAALATAAISLLQRRFTRRHIALVGLLLLLAGDIASTQRLDIFGFGLVRVLAGIGEGTAAGVMAATISGMSAPDRLMGTYNGLAMIILAAAFLAAPVLVSHWGMAAVFIALAATTLPALLFNNRYPDSPAARIEGAGRTAPTPPLAVGPAALALAGTASFYLALGGIWPFMGEVGRHHGLSTDQVARVLSLSQIAGAAGSFLPALVGRRLGRTLPLAGATLGATIAVVALMAPSGGAYGWAAPLFMGCAMLFFAYLMGVIAGVDPLGRVASLSFAIQTVGLGIGPAWAGLTVARFGDAGALWVGAISIPACMLFLGPLARGQDRRHRALEPISPLA